MGQSRPKGSPKTQGSGRKSGVPNKITQYKATLEERCLARGIDIWDAMLDCANEAEDLTVKFVILKELAQYVYSKKRAIEITGEVDVAISRRAEEIKAMTPEERKKLAESLARE